MKLAIGIPNTGTIKSKTVLSLCAVLKDLPYEYNVILHEGSILHIMRERIVQKAIDLGCTHLLFVDSDMTFDKDAVMRLIEANKAIVGANYNTRKHPSEPTAQLTTETEGNLTKAVSVATGFMLINLEVFKKITKPWFFWHYHEDDRLALGEDYWFCLKAQEAGYEVWCDLSVKVGHIGDYVY